LIDIIHILGIILLSASFILLGVLLYNFGKFSDTELIAYIGSSFQVAGVAILMYEGIVLIW
jgi:hypothetical protein